MYYELKFPYGKKRNKIMNQEPIISKLSICWLIIITSNYFQDMINIVLAYFSWSENHKDIVLCCFC